MKKYSPIIFLFIFFAQSSIVLAQDYNSYWAQENARRLQEAKENQYKIDDAAWQSSNNLRKQETTRKVQTTIDSILMQGKNMVTDKVVRTAAQQRADRIISESQKKVLLEQERRNSELAKNPIRTNNVDTARDQQALIDAQAKLNEAISKRDKDDSEKNSEAVIQAYTNVEKLISASQKKVEGVTSKKDLSPQEIIEMKRQAQLKLKKDLNNIKDKSKKVKVENIVNNFEQVNKKVTNSATETVSKIETVLLTLESRLASLVARGLYTGDAKLLISDAKIALVDAKSAISFQDSKIYEAEIVDDVTVKDSLQDTREVFKSDIETMKQKIKIAHEKVKSASDSLKVANQYNENTSVE
jgi:hypothetical protein